MGQRSLRLAVGVALAQSLLTVMYPMANGESGEGSPKDAFSTEGGPSAIGGPLQLKSQALFQQLHLSLTPGSVRVLPKRRWQLQQTVTWTKHWGYIPEAYLADAETVRARTTLKYGLSDSFQLSLEIPVVWRGGGIMDSFIDEFHHELDLASGRREALPNRELHLRFQQDGRWIELLDEEDAGMGLGDIVVSGQYVILKERGNTPGMALGLAVKAPTGDKANLFGSGGVDGGLWLALGKQLGRFGLYFSPGVVLYGHHDMRGPNMREGHGSLMAAVEYHISSRSSLLLQYLYTTSAARNLYEFSSGTHEIAVGFRTCVGKGIGIELGLIENAVDYENSPDFGVYVRIAGESRCRLP